MKRSEIPLSAGAGTALLVGLVYLLVASDGTFRFGQSAYPHHVLIADAWLHGQLAARDEALRLRSDESVQFLRRELEDQLASRDSTLAASDWDRLHANLPPVPAMQDWSVVDGRYYGYWGPMPALLLLPYVALAGLAASDILLSCLLGTTTIFLMFLVLRQAHARGVLETTTGQCAALSLLFGLGTVHFYLTVVAQVWYLSQVVATFFICLAIYCILRTRDGVGWPIAASAAFGAALLSRASLLPTLVFFYVALWAFPLQSSGASTRQRARQAIAFSIPLMIAGTITALFNYARFGSVLETGLLVQTFTGAGEIFKERYERYGFFSWHYLGRNLYYYFINPDLAHAAGTGALTFDPQGNSVFLVTPAFLYVFRANPRVGWFVRALWLATAGVVVMLLLFFGTGYFQFGNRYLLEVIPFAILLVAIGMRGRLTRVATLLIGLSIVVNAWGTYRFCIEGRLPGGTAAHAAVLREQLAAERFNDASALAARGQVREATALYRDALRLQPDRAESHLNLGNLLSGQGRRDDAVVEYEAALRVQPTYAEAHNSLGIALAEQGKIAAAIAQFEAAIRFKPDYPEPHSNLGNVLQARGMLAEAIGEYEAALRLRPDYAGAQNNLGMALVAQGKTGEALAHFERAAELDPHLVEARTNLAAARRQLAGARPVPADPVR